jgi:hypothetical protein
VATMTRPEGRYLTMNDAFPSLALPRSGSGSSTHNGGALSPAVPSSPSERYSLIIIVVYSAMERNKRGVFSELAGAMASGPIL